MKTRVVDINDTKHRYYLARELTHKEMGPQFGVTFIAVGKYYPNRAMATEGAPALQLHISGEEEGVNKAVEWVQTVIEKGPPTSKPVLQGSGQKYMLPFPFEEAHVFALRNAIQGAQGENLKFISGHCGASISMRGRGSGSITTAEDRKDPFHLAISSSSDKNLKEAQELLDDLMKVVEFEYTTSKQLGYFTPLGGMFAPDQVLVQAANKAPVVSPLPMIGAIPMYYPASTPSVNIPFNRSGQYPQNESNKK